jgi:hypothetical protein
MNTPRKLTDPQIRFLAAAAADENPFWNERLDRFEHGRARASLLRVRAQLYESGLVDRRPNEPWWRTGITDERRKALSTQNIC